MIVRIFVKRVDQSRAALHVHDSSFSWPARLWVRQRTYWHLHGIWIDLHENRFYHSWLTKYRIILAGVFSNVTKPPFFGFRYEDNQQNEMNDLFESIRMIKFFESNFINQGNFQLTTKIERFNFFHFERISWEIWFELAEIVFPFPDSLE